MNKTNESYLIRSVTSHGEELYFRADGRWWKTSTRGRVFSCTAEQVLNHVLPMLAGLAPGLQLRVEHYEAPTERPLPRLPASEDLHKVPR